MSDSVTPPRPTAPTAAELREALADRARLSRGDLDRIDDLMAAVRAEALEEAARAFDGPAHKVAALGFIRERIRALVSK